VARRDDEFGKPGEIDLEICRLAKLRTVDYEQVRKEAAAKLSIRALKYVVLTENDALAVAMWNPARLLFRCVACTPRLAITAPEKRCGKTTLLDVIGLLVPRPLSTAGFLPGTAWE
jgi:hypothetical protein